MSRFADVDAFSRDPKTFCSSHGTVMEMLGPEPTEMEIMIFMDPPEHTRYRRLVSKAFTPRRMALLEEDIRVTLRRTARRPGREEHVRLRAGLRGQGARLRDRCPVGCADPDDRDMVRGLIDETFHLDPEKGMYNDISFAAMEKLHDYMRAVLTDRQKNPRDDMFTDLLNGEIVDEDGQPRRLTMEQALELRQS